MAEKVKLLALGTIASLFVALISFLSASYLGGFVTRAEFNKEMSVIEAVRVELKYLRNGQEEIKDLLRK